MGQIYEQTDMKPIHTTALAVLICLVATACQPDDAGLEPRAPQLSLANPQPGQRAYFERIALQAHQVQPQLFRDTLILEIEGIQGDDILVTEFLSSGSISMQSSGFEVSFPEERWTYRLSPKQASLNILPSAGQNRLNSRLFPSLDDAQQMLRRPVAAEMASIEGLRVQTDYLPVDRDLKLENQPDDRAVSLRHSGRAEGLPGFTFVHNADLGLLWMLVEQDLEGNASGWRLIENR